MKKIYLFLALFLLPTFVAAQGTGPIVTNATTLVMRLQGLINLIIPLLIGIAALMFIFGIIKYVISKDPEQQKEARGVIIWGVIILFVMLAFWGLVNILINTFGLETQLEKDKLPKVPVYGEEDGSTDVDIIVDP